tara:strand:+ start:227 stop:430 length:204 start_codon:yes stop_codon:yes gene_type:complete
MVPHLDNSLAIFIWHLLVGYLLTVSLDWNWIPLTAEEKKRGPSLDQIRSSIFDLDKFMEEWKDDFKE